MIETGHKNLDQILGGGVVSSGIIEFYGFEQSGKTSLAVQIAGATKSSIFFDFDGSIPRWALKTKGLLVSDYHILLETDTLRDKLCAILSHICDTINPAVIILDPIAVLGRSGINILLTHISSLSSHRLFILINHSYQNKESVAFSSTSYYCSQRLMFGKGMPIIENDVPVGIKSLVTVTKNTQAFFPQSASISIPFTGGL